MDADPIIHRIHANALEDEVTWGLGSDPIERAGPAAIRYGRKNWPRRFDPAATPADVLPG